jgi:hypothetical protein
MEIVGDPDLEKDVRLLAYLVDDLYGTSQLRRMDEAAGHGERGGCWKLREVEGDKNQDQRVPREHDPETVYPSEPGPLAGGPKVGMEERRDGEHDSGEQEE